MHEGQAHLPVVFLLSGKEGTVLCRSGPHQDTGEGACVPFSGLHLCSFLLAQFARAAAIAPLEQTGQMVLIGETHPWCN